MALRLPALFGGRRQDPPPAAAIIPSTTTPTLTRGAPRTNYQEDARIGTAFYRWPQRRGTTPGQARGFSDSNEFLRAAINRVKDRVARADRAIMPIDHERAFSTELQARISYLLENPNPRGDSWRSFIEPVLEDLCVLGRGGWEYVKNWRGWPIALYPFDAQFMTVDPTWDGSNPREARYFWSPFPRQSIGLRNDEVTLLVLNPRADRVDGLGWVDTLRDICEADAACNEFVRTLLQKYLPPGWIDLGPNAGRKQVDAFSEKLSTDVLGRGGLMVSGGTTDAKFIPLWSGNSRDNQLIEWGQYFGSKVAAVAGISPQDIGLTMDVNRATADSQSRVSSESGYKSMLMLVQEYVNREILGKFGTPESLNLHFVFAELTARDRAEQIKLATEMAGGLPIALYNEARAEADLPPLALGNVVLVKTAGGAVAMIGEDAEAYHRQAHLQVGQLMDEEAQDKQRPSGKEKATPNKKPKAAPAPPAKKGPAGGAATKEQDDAASNKTPKGTK